MRSSIFFAAAGLATALGLAALEGSGGTASAQPAGLPDLTVDAVRLKNTVVVEIRNFSRNDCGLVEGCVGGKGKRVLMRFDVAIPNLGNADLVLGDPTKSTDFVYSPRTSSGFRRPRGLRTTLATTRGSRSAGRTSTAPISTATGST